MLQLRLKIGCMLAAPMLLSSTFLPTFAHANDNQQRDRCAHSPLNARRRGACWRAGQIGSFHKFLKWWK